MWVDRDNNCAFDDYSIILSTADAATFTGNVDVPAGQAPGSYRMRIRIWFSSGGNPCGTEVYGEVEDYALIVP